jgi:prevent-host-death family protein
MPSWPVQEAKAKFSEFLDTALKKGPQIVTRRGVETAVLVPIDEWRRLKDSDKPTLKELLLNRGPKFDHDIAPPRGKLKWRNPPEFE